ncbi:MAG: Uma2 family endonuclease [Treponemataceae bacterium]
MNHPGDTAVEGTAALKNEKRYTYADYKTWPEGERWELIKGVPYAMSPAPVRRHQRLVGLLFLQLGKWFEGKACVPMLSPLDIFLPETDESLDATDTVVQPDLVVVCDESKLVDEGVRGAPDFAIEILSPSTAWRDQTEKRDLYEKHGVREFWVINPETREVTAWNLENGKFSLPRAGSLAVGMDVPIYPGLNLKVTEKL